MGLVTAVCGHVVTSHNRPVGINGALIEPRLVSVLFPFSFQSLEISLIGRCLYGRPYQSKVVRVHGWLPRNRSLWLSLLIVGRIHICRSL